MNTIWFVVAGDPGQYTGGYLYDARIAGALERLGHSVKTIGLPGRFPNADTTAAEALDEALTRRDRRDMVIIDGLVMGGLPEIIHKHARRLRIVALVHHPLAEEYGIEPALAKHFALTERTALQEVRRIIVTSRFAARRLIASYGADPAAVSVVEPGQDRVDIPPRSRRLTATPNLLCVATLIPRKGHAVLVEALAQIADLDWHCDCIGALDRDPACTARVRTAINKQGLAERIRLLGQQPPGVLAAAYGKATLCVLASYYEGYGMVITEALAHGLPIVTTTGGALADTLPRGAGITIPPGDSTALAEALRRILTDEALQATLADRARQVANTLPDWTAAGRSFSNALDQFDHPPVE